VTSFLAKLANSTLSLNYFYLCCFKLGKNSKLKPKTLESNRSLRSSLLINVRSFSYKGTSIYRRPWGLSITPITPFPFLTNSFTCFSRV
jgi:hypothetical protein